MGNIRPQIVGEVEQYVGVRAAPDRRGRGLIAALTGRYGRDMGGGYDQNAGVVGYDRGDPAHSYTGWVAAAPSPTAAIASIASPYGTYAELATYQDSAQSNPALDPHKRLLFARMVQGR